MRFEKGSAIYTATSDLTKRAIWVYNPKGKSGWEYEQVYTLKIGETEDLGARRHSLDIYLSGYTMLSDFDKLSAKEAKNRRLFVESYVRLKLGEKYKEYLHKSNTAKEVDHFFFTNKEKRDEAEDWVFDVIDEAIEIMSKIF
jgi:hypothetical protein